MKKLRCGTCLACSVLALLCLGAGLIALLIPTKPPQPTSPSATEVLSQQVETPDTASTKPATFLVTRIIDGDTIELESGQTVRYIGIDTPETPNDCYSNEATNKNKELVEGKYVQLDKDVSETDRYGRLLRYVYTEGVFVNDALVSKGYAKATSYPPDVKYQETFRASEAYARDNNLGLWGPVCNKPTPPPAIVVPTPASPSYNCNCSKTCPQMSSCEEAYYQLNTCGCNKRDGDNDGVPCESICPGG